MPILTCCNVTEAHADTADSPRGRLACSFPRPLYTLKLNGTAITHAMKGARVCLFVPVHTDNFRSRMRERANERTCRRPCRVQGDLELQPVAPFVILTLVQPSTSLVGEAENSRPWLMTRTAVYITVLDRSTIFVFTDYCAILMCGVHSGTCMPSGAVVVRRR